MIIKGDNFELSSDGGIHFDLSVLVKVNEGKSNEREEMKVIAYGLTFNESIHYIVSYKLNSRDIECSLSEYVSLYKEEVSKIEELLNKK